MYWVMLLPLPVLSSETIKLSASFTEVVLYIVPWDCSLLVQVVALTIVQLLG